MSKKGFTLLECLLTLFILSSLFVLSLTNFKVGSNQYREFIADYNYLQASSFNQSGTTYYLNEYSKYPISFNSNSTVNMGQSFNIGNRRIVIRPITGYIKDE